MCGSSYYYYYYKHTTSSFILILFLSLEFDLFFFRVKIGSVGGGRRQFSFWQTDSVNVWLSWRLIEDENDDGCRMILAWDEWLWFEIAQILQKSVWWSVVWLDFSFIFFVVKIFELKKSYISMMIGQITFTNVEEKKTITTDWLIFVLPEKMYIIYVFSWIFFSFSFSLVEPFCYLSSRFLSFFSISLALILECFMFHIWKKWTNFFSRLHFITLSIDINYFFFKSSNNSISLS